MKALVLPALLSIFISQAYASGSAGVYGQATSDNHFKQGKAIVSGRHADYSGISICLQQEGDGLLSLAKPQLKEFSSARQLMGALYNCDNQQPLVGHMPLNDITDITVYLKKRYNLDI